MNQSYSHPAARAYIIKFIPHTAPNAYHVINASTKVTHSTWDDPLKARQVAADLNLAIRRGRCVAASQTKKQSHLRVVK